MSDYIEREAALDCFACDLGNKDYSVSYQGFMTEDDGEMMCVKDADWCVEDGCYYGFTESHDADWFCADGARMDGGKNADV